MVDTKILEKVKAWWNELSMLQVDFMIEEYYNEVQPTWSFEEKLLFYFNKKSEHESTCKEDLEVGEVVAFIPTLQEIDEQIEKTESRGGLVVKYLNEYIGQPIYNEIALAIEFGYQLSESEMESRTVAPQSKTPVGEKSAMMDNNGWIKIESESDLPINTTLCHVQDFDKNIGITNLYQNMGFLSQYTHYQPIIKPQPPIYPSDKWIEQEATIKELVEALEAMLSRFEHSDEGMVKADNVRNKARETLKKFNNRRNK